MLCICIFNFTLLQRQISTEEIALISYVIFFTLALLVVFVVFFITFQRRKNKLMLDKLNQQKAFDQELVRTQQEIQDETLKHVGRELHDNVGQILSYATMQMNAVVKNVPEALSPRANEAAQALKNSLAEVRALSKSLNSDVIYNLGFDKTLTNEIERLNKIGELEASLSIVGDKVNFENKKDEIILFRILQEFYSNTLKYAEASELRTSIIYNPQNLIVEVTENGKGFDINTVEKGSGLINMEKRSEMIRAKFTIESQIGEGTKLTLEYPFQL
jgi:signal transduction histidine kinase